MSSYAKLKKRFTIIGVLVAPSGSISCGFPGSLFTAVFFFLFLILRLRTRGSWVTPRQATSRASCVSWGERFRRKREKRSGMISR